MTEKSVHALVMAAGKGTRMKSAQAKVLQPALNAPLLEHVLRTVQQAGIGAATVVVGHQAEAVEAAFASRGLAFVRQDPPLGTGHAVQCAREALSASGASTVVVLSGDVPLLRKETLRLLLATHHESAAAATVLTVSLPDAGAYGRVLRDEDGGVRRIVEAKDATPEERAVREINAGIYAFAIPALLEVLSDLTPQNAQGEYYLTDVIGLLRARNLPVAALCAADPAEALGVNTLVELAEITRILQERRLTELMLAGVTIEDPRSTVVGLDVIAEAGVVIRPFTVLEGRTTLRTGATVGPYARLRDTEVGKGAHILDHCLLLQSVVEEGASVGPFAHIRPESRIGANAKVGNFVELKKTHLGRGSKAPHLAYIGDATIGEKVNLGAGTITCNYDGTHKHQTRIEDGAFVGSNSTLVAPLTIGAGAYVGAGSAITEDVPAGALALGRARQVSKAGWAAGRGKKDAAPTAGPASAPTAGHTPDTPRKD